MLYGSANYRLIHYNGCGDDEYHTPSTPPEHPRDGWQVEEDFVDAIRDDVLHGSFRPRCHVMHTISFAD